MQFRIIALALVFVLARSASAHEIGHEREHVEGGWNAEAGFVSDVGIEAKPWNPRGKSQEEIDQRAEYLAKFFDLGRTAEERASDDEIKARYADAIVINSLMPSGIGIQGVAEEQFKIAADHNFDNQITLMSISVYGFPGVHDVSFEDTLTRTNAAIERFGLVRAQSVDDIRQAKADSMLAVIYNAQGGDFAIEDLNKVMWAKKAGIQVMNFTYNNDSALAGGGQNPENNGVTELGAEFIRRMNEARIIVDCSHSSDQACIDAARHSKLPVIASHSGAKAIYDHGRNVSDEAAKAIADTGGVICAAGVGLFLNADGNATMDELAKHVNYVGDLVGREHRCYGSDYSYMYKSFLEDFIAVVDKYPPEKGFAAPTQNAHGGDIWGVARVLENEYGWSEDDIRGFLSENLMRVFAANWD